MASKQKANQTSGKIAAFTKHYSNPSTAAGYKNAIESFLRCVFELAKTDSDGSRAKYDYENYFSRYLSEKRNYDDDFKKFATCLSNECKSKQSARQIMTYARLILKDNGAIIQDDTVRTLKRELSGGKQTVAMDLSADKICKIVTGADARGKAIVLIAASSGLRINELLALKMKKTTDDDSFIDFNSKPMQITVSAKDSKNGYPRFTFISSEAENALKIWMNVRNDYLKNAVFHGENLQKIAVLKENGKIYTLTSEDDTRIFPYSDNAITSMWLTLVSRAGFYNKNSTTKNPYNFHKLRGFFISALAYSGKKEFAEFLAGHTGYLDGSYRMAPENAGSEYAAVESVLRVCISSDVKQELKDLKTENTQTREMVTVNHDAYTGMKAINEQLQTRVNEMSAQMSAIMQQQKKLMEILELHEIPDKTTLIGTKTL
jgi:integrase